ncbi:hypothetical protein LGL55_00295 [Clostridium tagluense]|uniref:hypothetical protein n=1 Tax=Clostridium tagluense TaxID=360422 RepID=UPI001CF16423|nr:hypothetical protein [Clostridium tagluense]MCB2309554.1 hypothetical protein [Clostridium tagluense]MCB2314916.1 hypothetical protein [Clostridium tagluense]MCB2319765.1 hypothetical protein [Clostridium tagluense]MCB2324148.1 hypothetical protein [Clostridium tagluense]MCB2328999.1 hypothetical protein [Clostridium tagluense]
MNFKNIKIKAIADRVMNRAVKSGFKKDDIEDFYIESLLKQTSSLRIRDFIELSYYKGIFKGFQYSETLINSNIVQCNSDTYADELQKQNTSLIKRLEDLNDMVFKIKEPPQNTGKIIQDGRNFVSYRNKFTNNINDAIKMAWDNKNYLDKK